MSKSVKDILAERDAALARADWADAATAALLEVVQRELRDDHTDDRYPDASCGCSACRIVARVADGTAAGRLLRDAGEAGAARMEAAEATARAARLEAQLTTAADRLDEIHDLAHGLSTGPSVPDGYWEIRAIAGRTLAPDGAAAVGDGKATIWPFAPPERSEP